MEPPPPPPPANPAALLGAIAVVPPTEKRYPSANLGVRAGDATLGAEELLRVGVFEGVAAEADGGKRLRETVKKSPGAVVLRRFRQGEVICRQGEAGHSAFYILTDEDLRKLGLPEAPAAGGAPDPGPATEVSLIHAGLKHDAGAGLFTRVARAIFGGPRKAARARPVYIPNDGPVDLRYEKPVDVMSAGDLFGELSCMSFAPRSATVRALRDCVMVEMLRSIFEELQKNAKFRAAMDETYRRRMLRGHLESLPFFHGLDKDVIDELLRRAKLERRAAGEVIFEQGATPDAMYVIRLGWVKVSRHAEGLDRVLAYCSRGETIGEMGVATGLPRNATCTAYDHPDPEEAAGGRGRKPDRTWVDLVRIDRDLFEELRARSPELQRRVNEIIRKRSVRERRQARALNLMGPVADLGLLQGQKLMLIDEDRCTRCDACVDACAATHDGRSRLVREGPRFGNLLIPATCRQCLDPVCMIGCPVGSIHKGESGQIEIESWCIGCGKCAENCPYGSINMHERRPDEVFESPGVEIIQKPVVAVVCDQCTSLGDASKPSCVYACPHDAAMRVDALDFFSDPLNTIRPDDSGERADRFRSHGDSSGSRDALDDSGDEA